MSVTVLFLLQQGFGRLWNCAWHEGPTKEENRPPFGKRYTFMQKSILIQVLHVVFMLQKTMSYNKNTGQHITLEYII